MTANEVLLRLADQGRSTMEDFLTLRPVRVTPTITKPTADVIAELQSQMDFEEEYADRAGLADKEREAHDAEIARIKRRMLRLQLRLEHDPDATEDVPGPMIEQMVPDVDLAKAAARGKLHLVKSYNAKDGKIELYDAHAGLVDIGRHHGLFVDKTALTDPTGTKEYADSTLDALRKRLITQLTTPSAGDGSGGVHPQPAPGGDDEASV